MEDLRRSNGGVNDDNCDGVNGGVNDDNGQMKESSFNLLNLDDYSCVVNRARIPRIMTVPGILTEFEEDNIADSGETETDQVSDVVSSVTPKRRIIVSNQLPVKAHRDGETKSGSGSSCTAPFLRKRFHRVRVGFFLHSPFPSSEIYRTLPVRDEILRSLLNCDLIGNTQMREKMIRVYKSLVELQKVADKKANIDIEPEKAVDKKENM
ncbi:hypothetical protein LXL04_010047 [Taraxacum kok-saghyz]